MDPDLNTGLAGNEGGLSIIIPVFNEERTIEEVLRNVLRRADVQGWDYELLVVDDGSTDATAEIIARLSREIPIHVISHKMNRGKGAAIRTGLEHASKPLTIVQDADLEYDPGDISTLLAAIQRCDVDAVLGSRVLGARAGMGKQRRNIYAIGVLVLNWSVRWLYGIHVTDEATCYKLFRTEDLRRMQLTCERFEFCPEVIAKAARMGLRITEVPISYSPRSTSEGKKIRFVDALSAVGTLWRFRKWTP
ncbi:MAG: glycosyltransferase family 2 protein [Planctomycetaceae bacterium]|nr:glycosyltransferase family 2 protein [Planctomycetaceae bacterium]